MECFNKIAAFDDDFFFPLLENRAAKTTSNINLLLQILTQASVNVSISVLVYLTDLIFAPGALQATSEAALFPVTSGADLLQL